MFGVQALRGSAWIDNISLASESTAPAFEVASVRTIRQDTRTWALRQVNPLLYRSLSNVMQLITWAWKVKNFQVLGAPAWISQERFEIQATTARSLSVDEERLMVQRLLASRFGLKVHREDKETPVYALVVEGTARNWRPRRREQIPGIAASILNPGFSSPAVARWMTLSTC